MKKNESVKNHYYCDSGTFNGVFHIPIDLPSIAVPCTMG